MRFMTVLTGLPNRELFFDRLETAVVRMQTVRANPPAIIYIDIDRFKNINSRFGMGVGDTMLLTVSRRLARYLRPEDALARIGSDQFAILLLGQTQQHEVTQLAERIRKALRSPVKIAGEEVISDEFYWKCRLRGFCRAPVKSFSGKPKLPCIAPSAWAPTA